MEELYAISLFDYSHTIAKSIFDGVTYPWEVLTRIKSYIAELGASLSPDEFDHPSEDIWIAKNAKVASSASITGPCIIDEGAEIRHCAFIRGSAIVGKKAVVGNSTELKNCILFDGAAVPHFNYIGDAVLGYKAHLGAGAVTSNVKSDKTLVIVKTANGNIATGLKKFGSMVGDNAEIGCNSVLCPGSVISRNCIIYPLSRVRGFIKADCIYKSPENIVVKIKKED